MNDLVKRVDKLNDSLHQQYLNISGQKHGIRHFGTKKTNGAIFLPAESDKTVILFHGFMASPPEMEPLGRHLQKQLHCNIYIPVIPGFAAHHSLCRHYSFNDWRQCVQDSIALMQTQTSDIILVGYSIGGGMVADYLLNHDIDKKVTAACLLSPYIQGAAWQMPWLGTRAAKTALSMMSGFSRNNTIKLTTVDALTSRRYTDLPVLLEDPDHYSQEFVFASAKNLMDMAKALKTVANTKNCSLPLFFGYSESDLTISWKHAKRYIDKHFLNLKETYVYNRRQHVPHEIVVDKKNINPYSKELFNAVSQFIEANTQKA